VECLEQTSKVNDDPHGRCNITQINQVGKTFNQQVSRFVMLNEHHKLNNLSEQSVSSANESSNYLDKTSSITCVNDCSGNTLLIGSVSSLTTSQNLSTKLPSKSKSKMKLSHQLNGSVPLTVYHQNNRIERESK